MSSVDRHPTVRHGFNRGPAFVGVVVLLAIAAVTALLIVSRRAETLRETQKDTAVLAQVLAEQTSRSMETVDLTLREIGADIAAEAAAGGAPVAEAMNSRATFDLLVDRRKDLPQAAALLVAGPDGSLRNFTRAFPAPYMDVSARDYYLHLSTVDDHTAFFSEPVRSLADGTWTMVLARRINDVHGKFAGIVGAAIALSSL